MQNDMSTIKGQNEENGSIEGPEDARGEGRKNTITRNRLGIRIPYLT